MVSSQFLCTLIAILGTLRVCAAGGNAGVFHAGEVARRAEERFAVDDAVAMLMPDAQRKEPKGSDLPDEIPKFTDRSAELYQGLYKGMEKRQNCQSGYWYCASA